MDAYHLELGRMTALFTDFDALIRDAVIDLLACTEEAIGTWLVAPVDFSRKIEMFEWLIDHHIQRVGEPAASETARVRELLPQVKDKWNKRNDHVHGMRMYDRRKGTYVLLNPRAFRQKRSKANTPRSVTIDANQLAAENQQSIRLLIELHKSIPPLLRLLNPVSAIRQRAGATDETP